jgi:hypothetical protein
MCTELREITATSIKENRASKRSSMTPISRLPAQFGLRRRGRGYLYWELWRYHGEWRLLDVREFRKLAVH